MKKRSGLQACFEEFQGKNLLLLLFSLIFYSAGSLVHLPLLLGVALVNYLAGLRFRGRRQGNRVVLILTLILRKRAAEKA